MIVIVLRLARLFEAILDQYHIGQFLSEPYQHHQNLSERHIQDIKHSTNAVMDRTGTPSKFWLLATLYVVMLYNVMSLESIDNRTPMQKLPVVISPMFLPSYISAGGNQFIT